MRLEKTGYKYIGTIDSGGDLQIRPYRRGDTHKKVFGSATECNNFFIHEDGGLVCGRLTNITKEGVRRKVAEYLHGVRLDSVYHYILRESARKRMLVQGERIGIGLELVRILSGVHDGD